MADIVERLDGHAAHWSGCTGREETVALCCDAATEITRLRTQLAEARDALEMARGAFCTPISRRREPGDFNNEARKYIERTLERIKEVGL